MRPSRNYPALPKPTRTVSPFSPPAEEVYCSRTLVRCRGRASSLLSVMRTSGRSLLVTEFLYWERPAIVSCWMEDHCSHCIGPKAAQHNVRRNYHEI